MICLILPESPASNNKNYNEDNEEYDNPRKQPFPQYGELANKPLCTSTAVVAHYFGVPIPNITVVFCQKVYSAVGGLAAATLLKIV